MKRIVPALALICFACSSATKIAPNKNVVRIVTDASLVAGCSEVGIIQATAPRSGSAEPPINSIREKAAANGADTIVVSPSATWGSLSSAAAYRFKPKQ